MAYRQKFLAKGGQAGVGGSRHQRRTISSDAETAFVVNEQNYTQNAENLCSSCRGEHHFSPDEMDLNELKSMISSRQDVDLPMIRALCDDTSLQDIRFRSGTNKNGSRCGTGTVARRPCGNDLLRPRSWHESAWLADNLVINKDFRPQNESFIDPNMTTSIEMSPSALVQPLQSSSYENRFSSTPNLAAPVASRNNCADAVLFLPPPPPYSTSNSALNQDQQWRCNFYPSRQNCAYDDEKLRGNFHARKNGATGDFVYNLANATDREEYTNFSNGVSGVYAVNCNVLAAEQATR
uniref:Uncharacterized protein n=1 Tax=Romanomermis culicivorax TaxID=13658 RepID=A0A915I8V4_ROMCU